MIQVSSRFGEPKRWDSRLPAVASERLSKCTLEGLNQEGGLTMSNALLECFRAPPTSEPHRKSNHLHLSH